MSWYCDIAPADPVHRPYHDQEYGFPLSDDRLLFERLALEIFQAGLSWRLVLVKRRALNEAFRGFDPAIVAGFGAIEIERLLGDARIIRNRRKIAAVVENAGRCLGLRAGFGSFANWLTAQHPRPQAEWLTTLRSQFRFMGPEVVREFLLSIGFLPGAHRASCPIYSEILTLNPPWLADGSAMRTTDD